QRVALLDKMDTIVGLFGIDLIPTGSKDPFALRRMALGVMRILISGNFTSVHLNKCIENAVEAYTQTGISLAEDTVSKVYDFMMDRFYYDMRTIYDHDVITAVSKTYTPDNVILDELSKRIIMLHDFLQTDQGKNVISLYRRAQGVCDLTDDTPIAQDLLTHISEKTLYTHIMALKENVSTALGNHQYTMALSHLQDIYAPLHDFFENVMVNVPEVDVTRNRKALLKDMLDTIKKIAIF
ncbi:MAG: glycine--tRNA ligase subunit beta, partial [Alphaproteobacteria bacterium]|nr:glycine--tRNA ligase subunit beta [Alphaproteobacteria bacterium]